LLFFGVFLQAYENGKKSGKKDLSHRDERPSTLIFGCFFRVFLLSFGVFYKRMKKGRKVGEKDLSHRDARPSTL
jgi:hypothetical protein